LLRYGAEEVCKAAMNIDLPGLSNGRPRSLGALAALFFLALSGLFLLAACGGGDEEESTASPSGTKTPAATQAPVGTSAAGATQTATSAAQASGGEIDPCSLVTKAEAEAIVGESVGEPVVMDTELLVSCLYSTPDLEGVSVDVLAYNDEEQAKSGFELALDINDYPEVEGIGDRAYDSRPIGDITVLKGKYELSIDVSASGQDEFEVAKELAAKAVDRLP
jgi:hypothetical protein